MKKGLVKFLFYLSITATVAFIASGYGYQWGLWGMGTAFTLLRYAAYAAIGLLGIQTIFFFLLKDAGFKAKGMVLVGFLFTLGVTATSVYWQYRAQSVPAIHDITTDLENPPEFVAMVRLRENAPNPPEYAGEETAKLQQQAYPSVQPLVVDMSKQEVIDEIVRLITERDWEFVSINRGEGRVEATEKLAWFGFKDDVVLKITDADGGTRVDMRSKSRIGRSDIGVNADRVERFMRDLKQAADR